MKILAMKDILAIIINKVQFRIRYCFKNLDNNIFTYYKNPLICAFDFMPFLKNKLITYNLKNGTKYITRANTIDLTVINEILVFKQYGNLVKFISEKSSIIDIGAHIGAFSILAAKMTSNGKIFSYEPDRENFAMLDKNIKINHLEKRITAFQLGVGKKRGEAEFYLDKKNSGMHSFYNKKGKLIKIKTITLADVFKSNKVKKCDFLKMDCEGAEYEIFYSTPRECFRKIKYIAMEYHRLGDIQKMKAFLKSNGFEITFGSYAMRILFARHLNS